ncbi:hypothetical protein ABKV19_025365 [Rosa sericea]
MEILLRRIQPYISRLQFQHYQGIKQTAPEDFRNAGPHYCENKCLKLPLKQIEVVSVMDSPCQLIRLIQM